MEIDHLSQSRRDDGEAYGLRCCQCLRQSALVFERKYEPIKCKWIAFSLEIRRKIVGVLIPITTKHATEFHSNSNPNIELCGVAVSIAIS